MKQRKRGPKAGLKMPRRINPHRYEAIQAAVAGRQGGVSIDEFDLEPAERYKELVRIRAKLYFEEEPEKARNDRGAGECQLQHRPQAGVRLLL